jgi:hypothetical protein
MAVGSHLLAERVESHAASEPARWNDHRQIAGLKLHGLANEEVVDWPRLPSSSGRVKLVGRVADDHVELHREELLGLVNGG